ncbi:class III lanthionine synthetase LanKC [Lysobacter enzymogenes]|uniref:class III lanthionine synthetase LanKC n=1 Tax=Lysobacter enzymogenes TaxID=69 RepID=UPI0038507C3C
MQDLIIPDKMDYLLADRQFYEPLSRYPAQLRDLHEPLRRILPPDWTLKQRNLWSDVSPPDLRLPEQGWKIHLSATPAHAPAILMTVARILFAKGISFKFISDRTLLSIVNGKRWGRGGAGKFITVYPNDQEQCGELLEALHAATTGYWGPYILSDRRYKDSRIVHYRYGGILPIKRAGVDGKAVLVIRDGDGEYVDDERTPYFSLPKGVTDPFQAPEAAPEEGEAGALKNGRYKIESVLAFSNSGGVYLAQDRDHGDRQVLIKEARPYTNISTRGLDAVQLLKKEHRLLGVVADLRCAPQPYDFFMDWEHAYLVEEFLEGYGELRSYLSRISLSLRTRPDAQASAEFYRKYRLLFAELARIVGSLHERRIIFSDLSFANVMARDAEDGGVDIKLIDFEGGFEEGVDVPTHLFTPGFSPEEFEARGSARYEDDYYALGCLMMAGLFPMNSLMVLNREAHLSYIEAFQRDFGLPEPIAALIRRLLDRDPAQRPLPDEMIAVLAEDFDPGVPQIGAGALDALDLAATTGRMLDYIDSVASFDREDRLYPADPAVFEGTPLSLAHGACGVAYVMHKLRGEVDPKVAEWIRDRKTPRDALSPGLFTGLSGIAWTLLEMGQGEQARAMLAKTRDHHLLWRSPDVFNGAAGWGLTQLRFYAETGEASYLDQALLAGRYLVESREFEDDDRSRCFWTAPEGVSASFGHGAAGIATFLLYLAQASGQKLFLEIGRQALEWVLSKGIDNPDGGLTWCARESTRSYTPYWRWGSSGVGRALLRYWHVTGEERYAQALDRVLIDCDRKYTIYPGYFFGIAGIAELCLDMARFPRWEAQALASARRVLAGCMLFPFERNGGLAFPGESLSRISCDFGTGSAGIALVMHRYLTRGGASLMVDELLPGWNREDRPAPAETERAVA